MARYAAFLECFRGIGKAAFELGFLLGMVGMAGCAADFGAAFKPGSAVRGLRERKVAAEPIFVDGSSRMGGAGPPPRRGISSSPSVRAGSKSGRTIES